MSCFDDYITVEGSCSDTTSTSGYTLKDAGIMLSELNDIVTKDYATGKALGEDKIEFARKLVINRISQHFAEKFISKSILDSQRIGFALNNKQVVNGVANELRGINIESCNQDSFISLFVSEISIFVNYSGVVAVQVWDLIQNKLIDTLNITAVSGEIVTSFVGKTYSSDRKDIDLVFIYDSTGINSIKTTVKKGGCVDCNGSGTSYFLNPYLRAKGIKIDSTDTKVKENLTGISDTAGLSVMYSVNCNYEAWMCTIRDRLALPMLYKAAEAVMEFTLHSSDRNNSRTIIDLDKNKSRMDFYTTKYNETIDNVLKNMTLPKDNKCFSCRERNRTITMLP